MKHKIDIYWMDYHNFLLKNPDLHPWYKQNDVVTDYIANKDTIRIIFPDGETATACKLKFGL